MFVTNRTEQISLLRDRGYNIVQILTGQSRRYIDDDGELHKFEGAAAIMQNEKGHQVLVDARGNVGEC